MNKIDSILNNFDAKSFLKELKSAKEGDDWCNDLVYYDDDSAEPLSSGYDNYINIKKKINSYTLGGAFFQKIREFKLIYSGDIDFGHNEPGEISIICFYSTIDKKYHLMIFEHWTSTHIFDKAIEYHYLKNFKSKPTIKIIEQTIKENKMRLPLLKNDPLNLKGSMKNIIKEENLILGKDYLIKTHKYF